MAYSGWKRFRFFQEEAHADAVLPSNVSCSCSLGGSIWLGCSDGLAVCVAHDLSVRATFQAHAVRLDHVSAVQGKLLTLGVDAADDGLQGLTLKLWAVEGLRADATPPCSLTLKLFPSGKPPEGGLAAVAVVAGDYPHCWVAVGLTTGAVHVLRVDTSKSRVTQPLPVLRLHSGGPASPPAAAQPQPASIASAVTGLHFVGWGGHSTGTISSPVGGAAGAAADQHHLFVVTAERMAAFSLRTGQKVLDEDHGAPVHCSAVRQVASGGSSSSHGAAGGSRAQGAAAGGGGEQQQQQQEHEEELLVAGDEAVYCYTVEAGRKAAYALKGSKLAIACAGRQLVAVLPENDSPGPSTSAGTAAGAVKVFDLQHKIVAASVAVEPPVRWIQSSGGRVLVGDATGSVVALAELPLSTRLEALYKARAFQLALALAESEQADAATLAAVRRRYGDFLYSKRDYDQAMEQYVGTIGCVEPSYVIQRFLDVQRIHNLTDYLEQLHSRGQASSDHTTLLLNCYTKAKDVAKLDRFIQAGAGEGGAEGGGGLPRRGDLPFDVDTAIKVLRAAGYYEHALFVALAAEEPQTYLDILLEDCQRFDEGLEFMRGLPRREAAQALQKYGKENKEQSAAQALLGVMPIETTALLMGLCLPDSSPPAGREGAPYVANMADFTQLYTDRPEDLQYACVTILAMCPDCPSAPTLHHTLLDLYLGGATARQQQGGLARTASGTSSVGGGNAGTSGQRDALDLLKRGWPAGGDPRYDVDHVLVVSRMHGFREGLLFLYENLRLYREACAVLMEAGDWAGLIVACERFGDPRTGGDPQLWHDALDYFARQEGDCTQQIQEVVSRIEAGGLLPPLAVLQSLGRNPSLRLELVKDYVTRQLQTEHRQIRADAEESERLKAEIHKTRAQLERLRTEPVVFQSSRDSQTGAPLELPSVHFLCGHSFNLRTLGGGDEAQQCPLCAGEHQKAADLRRSNKASAADKDTFFKQLRSAPDGFSLVADYFGRGLLNHTSVSIDAPGS